MPLKERRLKFFCGLCPNDGIQYAALVDQLLLRLKPAFDVGLLNLRETTEEHISSLSKQVADLSQSNRELIKLLDPVLTSVVHVGQLNPELQTVGGSKAKEAPLHVKPSSARQSLGNGGRASKVATPPKVTTPSPFEAVPVGDR